MCTTVEDRSALVKRSETAKIVVIGKMDICGEKYVLGVLCLALVVVVLIDGANADSAAADQNYGRGGGSSGMSSRQSRYRSPRCELQRLQAIQPNRRIDAEGGFTEIWEQYKYEQLDCAGVSAARTTIRPNGLYLPVYSNAAKLTYVVQGECVHSEVIPGCPETYQQAAGGQQQQQQQQGGRRADEHQKVRRLKRGDIVATPPGFVQWFYNDGNTDLVLVTLLDTANSQNQLDNQDRDFFLAGNPREAEQKQQQQDQGASSEVNYNNIFSGFADEILQEVLGTSRETVERVKGRNDYRGHIILVRHGLQMIKPLRYEEEDEQQRQLTTTTASNGFEETICTARLRENMGNPARADVYNPQAGYIRNVNRLNLPVLGYLYLSAERGVLYRNAIYAPHWNLYSHSIIYATRGTARVQIVGNQQRQSLFDGQLRQGQLLVVPQNFAVTAQAGSNGFEWISFKTGDNAISQSLAGKTSALRALPLDMLASMYQITSQEALKIKYNRAEQLAIFPSSTLSSCNTYPSKH
ncbi:hypothetical protein Sjap_006277 [Stephania japonica]|uniref:Cupin type-1 domain-containing protein n=1 Tax=Stephania japonica TaxID=461633 RepID=A0AAP0K790_9MAGN